MRTARQTVQHKNRCDLILDKIMEARSLIDDSIKLMERQNSDFYVDLALDLNSAVDELQTARDRLLPHISGFSSGRAAQNAIGHLKGTK